MARRFYEPEAGRHPKPYEVDDTRDPIECEETFERHPSWIDSDFNRDRARFSDARPFQRYQDRQWSADEDFSELRRHNAGYAGAAQSRRGGHPEGYSGRRMFPRAAERSAGIGSTFPALSGARYGGGSESRPYGRAHKGDYYGVGPKGYTRSDDRLMELVCESLAEAGELDASEIIVDVKDGVIVLKGSVPDRYQKYLAEELADQVVGVREIDNQLRVPRVPGVASTTTEKGN